MPRHLAFPFRLENGALATVEQDTVEEVTQNVHVLALTPVGFFEHDPEIGVEDPLFIQLPVQVEDFEEAVARFEPRAVVAIGDDVDDAMIALGEDRVGVAVSLAEGG
jgi:hypothetical protein